MNLHFKNHLHIFLFVILFCFPALYSSGQNDNKTLWKELDLKQLSFALKEKSLTPDQFRALRLDFNSMKTVLEAAPPEHAQRTSHPGIEIQLPMPDGSWERFNVVESPVMEPGLAAAYPFIKTYAAQGIDDPDATARLDITLFGFHSMILSPKGMMFIEPASLGNAGDYICYDKKHSRRRNFSCEADPLTEREEEIHSYSALRSSGTQLRTYRLALACTGEYAAFYGGTVSGALSGIVTSVNRVDGVYEQELGIRMVLIPNDTLIIYTNGATDPYTNGSGSTMLTENQNNITSVIGSANYDIGHVFSTGGGGIAGLNVVCSSGGKSRGVTGSGSPVGDGYDIDYVAHEMGHQFGGHHTFNSITGSCNGNGTASTAYEPGSGITIMAYAGICGSDNLDPHSIAYFHTISFDEIVVFSTTGTGNTCPVITGSGNTPPVVTSMGTSVSIPISTPFVLAGAATDANGDPLTYSWEEFDLGPFGAWNVQSTTAPMFRPFSPTSSPSRIFPKLSDIINNTTTVGELLPNLARTLKFRLTARDNRIGGGGVMHPDTTLNIFVVNNGGAFAVTAPNTAVTWGTGTAQTVTWNVSGTTNAPVNCANVKISLSTDGGNTFPTVLLASTPNDGTEPITVPNLLTTQARVKVEAIGNIFFDMSNTNFTIQSSTGVLALITTSALAGTNFCVGAAMNVSFTTDAPANSGNIFTAQLSNAAGSFASPVNLGTLNSVNSGTINTTVPAGTVSGTGYRVRVVSSSPVVTGSDNGTNISIFGIPSAASPVSGPSTVCQGQSGVVYSVASIANATGYSWTLPTGAGITSGTNTNSITVSYSTTATSGSIAVTGTNAGCNGTTSPALPVTVNLLPTAAGTITGSLSVCQNQAGVSYSIPVIGNATGYLWTLSSGASITSGLNSNTIAVTFSSSAVSGTISVRGTNACGNGTTPSTMTVTVNPAPTAAVITAGGATTFCTGGSVNLSFTTAGGVTYQWRKDGTNISGATASSYSANSQGTYDVVASITTAGLQTFSNTTPVFIPDNTCTNPAIDSIVVSGYTGAIASSAISIKINITHTWDGDLDLILEAANGSKLGLSNRTGSVNNSGANFTNTIFSDVGATAITTTGAPYTSTYKPWATTFATCVSTTITSFAAIGGGSINPNGIWKLHAYDRGAQDTGRIQNWSMTIPAATPSICSSTSNAISVTVNTAPTISNFSPPSGGAGTSVTINGTNFNSATAVLFNGTNAAFVINNDSQITATVPAGAMSGVISVANPFCSANSSASFSVMSSSPVTLNLKLFLQACYIANGLMTAVADPIGHPAVCDTIVVELHQPVAPYNLVATVKNTINTNGNGSFLFSSLPLSSYYIVVTHRNTMETWSKNPVPFNSSSVSFDFTSP